MDGRREDRRNRILRSGKVVEEPACQESPVSIRWESWIYPRSISAASDPRGRQVARVVGRKFAHLCGGNSSGRTKLPFFIDGNEESVSDRHTLDQRLVDPRRAQLVLPTGTLTIAICVI